ncbi:MAG: HAD-IIIA family hydrolase [Candidatus Eremiobacteraeota bacterium]|nr:HAD-IIIA family hydrolase [Candidatus Eremiobacteraeota bacterium]
MFRPDLYFTAIWMIDFKALSQRGIDYLLIDVDSTIADHHSKTIDPRAKEVLLEAFNEGYIKNACLVSNVMYGKRRMRRVASMAGELGIPFVGAPFFCAKPNASPFLTGLEKMNASPGNTAMIGDQIFTDILGGNRLGMLTILIKPLGKIHWTTRLLLRRARERRLLRKLGLKPDDNDKDIII